MSKQSKISRFFGGFQTNKTSSSNVISSSPSTSSNAKLNNNTNHIIDLIDDAPEDNSDCDVAIFSDSKTSKSSSLAGSSTSSKGAPLTNNNLKSPKATIASPVSHSSISFDSTFKEPTPLSNDRKLKLKEALDDIFLHPSKTTPSNNSAINDASKKTPSTKLTPLEQQVLDLRSLYSDCLLLVECGYRMRFFGEDAQIASKVLGIFSHKSHSFMVASVPTFRVIVHTRRLVSNGHKVAIVRQTETAAMKKSSDSKSSMFKRSIAGIFSPGCDVDEDDPAFQGLLTLNESEGVNDAEGDDDDNEDGGEGDGMNLEEADSEELAEGAAANKSNPNSLDFNDNWILTISEHSTETSSLNSSIGCLFVNIRGHCVHYIVIQTDETRQSLLDEMDIFQPSEIILPNDISQLTMNAIRLRSIDTSISTSSNAYLKRLNYFSMDVFEMMTLSGVKPNLTDKSKQTFFKQLHSEIDLSWAFPSKIPKLIVNCLSGISWFLFKMNSIFAISNPAILHENDTGYSSNNLNKPSIKINKSFKLDGITSRDLEVFTMRSHSHIQNSSKIIDINRGKIQKNYNSIFAFLDRCRTTFGKRKLKLWLLNPLIDINEIQERQLCIEWILKKGVYSTRYSDSWSKKVSDLLGDMPDLERFLTSLHNHKISPKSFINLLQSVIKLEQLHIICNTNSDNEPLPKMLQRCIDSIQPISIASECRTILAELNIPACLNNDYTNIFNENSELYQICNSKLKASNSNSILSSKLLISKYCECIRLKNSLKQAEEIFESRLQSIRSKLKKPNLEYKTLRIGPTSKIEYLIELSVNDTVGIPKDWVVVNSTKAFIRYHDPLVLETLESTNRMRDELLFASRECWRYFIEDNQNAINDTVSSVQATQDTYKVHISPLHDKLRKIISELSTIDVLLSLSDIANRPGYCKPNYHASDDPINGSKISVSGARHSLAELQLENCGKSFIPNDINLSCDFKDRSCLVITGPNMGGKSCYTITVALIALLGQIGSFVPAERADLIAYDNILTRMGADDDIASGQSTFMIELSRMKRMMSMATSRSLLIVDELGRGTSTNDGVSIAMATAKYIINTIGCSMLFVTHYFLISKLIIDPKVAYCRMSYLEENSENDSSVHTNDNDKELNASKNIIFLYKLVEGTSSGSYGLNVANLARISDDVISRAYQMSKRMLDNSNSLLFSDSVVGSMHLRDRNIIGQGSINSESHSNDSLADDTADSHENKRYRSI